MARRWLYQQFAKPPPQPAVSTSTPAIFSIVTAVWTTALSAACMASGGVLPPVQPTTPTVAVVKLDSIPVWDKSATTACVATGWIVLPPVQPAPTVTIPSIKYQALSEPVSTKIVVQHTSRQFPAVQSAPAVVPNISYRPWSEPVLPKPQQQTVVGFVAYSTPTTPVVPAPDIQYPPWSEPVLPLPQQQTVISFIPGAAGAAPAVPANLEWLVPLSEPPTDKPWQWSFEQSVTLFGVSPASWAQPWSEPQRPKSLTALQAPFTAYTRFVPTVAATVPNIRYQPLSTPAQKPAHNDTLVTFVPNTPSVTPPVPENMASWFVPWSGRPIYRSWEYQFDQTISFTIVNTGWNQPWSEPQRTKHYYATRAQDLAYVRFVPSVAPTVPKTLYPPLSEPTRIKRLTEADRLGYVRFTAPVTPPTTLTDYWLAPLSEPIRTRPAVQQGFIAQPSFVATPFSWNVPFAEPIQARRLTDLGQFAFVPVVQAVTPVNTAWFTALSEPQRRSPATLEGQSVLVPLVQAPSVVVPLIQYQPWSEPVLSRWPKAFASETQAIAFIGEPIRPAPAIRYLPWSEPVLPRWPKAFASEVQTSAYLRVVFKIIPPPTPIQYLPWSIPVMPRVAGGLPTQLQMFMASFGPIFPIPTPPVVTDLYTVSGGQVHDQYPIQGVSMVPDAGLGTQRHTQKP